MKKAGRRIVDSGKIWGKRTTINNEITRGIGLTVCQCSAQYQKMALTTTEILKLAGRAVDDGAVAREVLTYNCIRLACG